MRILHTVEFYYPSVGGAQEVVKQISERLARLGHEVTVATTKLPDRITREFNGVKIVEFDIHGRTATGYEGRDIDKYRKFLTASNYDVMMNYAAQQWATDLALEEIDNIKTAKVLVPCGFSGLYDPVYKQYFENLPKIMKKYDASVYLSNDYRDINFARDNKIKHLKIIPNGAGKDEFCQEINFSIRNILGIPNDNFLILCVGSHTGLKGHTEAIEIFRRAKIRNATLLIVANDFGGGCTESCKKSELNSRKSIRYFLDKKQIVIRELPRIETIAAYHSADMFLFPSNIEASPLVLFESMAAKLPFLTTDVGNSKEIIKWSHGGKLLPTTKDNDGLSHADINKSAKLLENWRNRSSIQTLGYHGYQAWKRRFTWEIITKRYESLYKDLVNGYR